MSAASWSAHYEAGVPDALPESDPHRTFHSILEAAAADAPGYRALECFNRGTRFAELDALADRVATALARDGFGRGDVALLVLPNGLHLAACSIGVLKAGGIIAPIVPGASDEALANAVERIEPAAAFTTAPRSGAIGEALAGVGGQLVVVRPESALPLLLRVVHRAGAFNAPRIRGNGCRSAISWKSWLSPSADAPDPGVSPGDPAMLVLDETDGHALCSFDHRHLVSGAQQLRMWLTDAIPGDDTWLVLEPLSTPFGFVVGLGASVMLRSRVALLPEWEGRDVIAALRYLRPTYVAAGGRAMSALSAAVEPGRADTRSVRAWLVGQTSDERSGRRFAEATGVSLCQGFGPPCTAGLAACNPVNSRRVGGSVGLPMPGVEVRLVGEDGTVAEPGHSGTLELRGPNVSAHGDWLGTGVEAYSDESGFLFLGDDGVPRKPAEATSRHARVL